MKNNCEKQLLSEKIWNKLKDFPTFELSLVFHIMNKLRCGITQKVMLRSVALTERL
jgi:hypothetical protein